jgi:hypothetical protein
MVYNASLVGRAIVVQSSDWLITRELLFFRLPAVFYENFISELKKDLLIGHKFLALLLVGHWL